MGSVVSAILNFHGKAVGFVAEHTWALMVLVAGLVGWWLMQKLKRVRSLPVLVKNFCVQSLDTKNFVLPHHQGWQILSRHTTRLVLSLLA